MKTSPLTLSAEDVVYAIDKAVPPRLRRGGAGRGDVATLDARAGRLTRPEEVEATAPDYRDRFPKANPATGPIFVEGAEPGDVLTAEILRIDLDARGYTLVKPDFGVIRGMVERPVARFAEVKDGAIDFAGVRAAAPPDDRRHRHRARRRAGRHRLCRPPRRQPRLQPDRRGRDGSTCRCGCPGALFFIGDVHAVMGDGEVSGSGFEIAARITVRLVARPRAGRRSGHGSKRRTRSRRLPRRRTSMTRRRWPSAP